MSALLSKHRVNIETDLNSDSFPLTSCWIIKCRYFRCFTNVNNQMANPYLGSLGHWDGRSSRLSKPCKTWQEIDSSHAERNVVKWRHFATSDILFMGTVGSKLGDNDRTAVSRKTQIHFVSNVWRKAGNQFAFWGRFSISDLSIMPQLLLCKQRLQNKRTNWRGEEGVAGRLGSSCWRHEQAEGCCSLQIRIDSARGNSQAGNWKFFMFHLQFQFSESGTMPVFQCKACGKKIQAEYEACDCTHSHNCHEKKSPVCCGKPMLEIMDD